MVTRTSAGIACCRFNNEKNQYEIIMVQKRYTYAFVDFVLGRYSQKLNKSILALINKMTVQERLDILSLNFNMLWFKIWCNFPKINPRDETRWANNDDSWMAIYKKITLVDYMKPSRMHNSRRGLYLKSKFKFDLLTSRDRGLRINNIIKMAGKPSVLMWEIPKGKVHKSEPMLHGAMREFEEETNIDLDFSDIVTGISPFVECYRNRNRVYRNIYYIASIKSNVTPSIDFSNILQVVEIGDIKWMGINELRNASNNTRIISTVESILKTVKMKPYITRSA